MTPRTAITGGVILLCLLSRAGAQNLHFDQMTSDQGLIQNSISCIMQDRQGFLWLGTWGGVCRYDGTRFMTFQFDPDDAASLSDNWTLSIMQDVTSRIWVCTRKGVSRFDPATERFERFLHDPADPRSISDDVATSAVEDDRGGIWIGTFSGLDRWSPERKGFDHFLIDPSRPGDITRNRVNKLLIDHTGMLWVGTPEGVWRIPIARLDAAPPGAAVPFERFLFSCQDSALLNANGVTALRETRDGTLWVGTYFGLVRIDRDRRSCRSYRHDGRMPHSLSHDQIRTILEDRNGTLWIGTWGGGVNRFRKTTDDFTSDRHSDADEHSLSDDFVMVMQEDRGGILWVGTRRGLNKALQNEAAFTEYRHNPASRTSLSSNDVWSICEDRRGDLWIGTYWSGLNRIRAANGTCTVYKRGAPGTCNVPADMVFAILEARDGTMWFGCGGGLLRYNPATEAFSSIASIPGELVALCEDTDGSLWCGTHGQGLFRFDPRTSQYTQYMAQKSDPRSLSDDRVLALHLDASGRLWIGTANGLNCFERASGTFSHYMARQGDPASLSYNIVLAIRSDAHGCIWAGTDGGGVNRLDVSTGRFEHYTERNGIPSSTIACILEGNDGSLWISTTRGLCVCDPVRRTFGHLDGYDNLPVTEYNRGAGYSNRSGALFFGGISGARVFRPWMLKKNASVPDVVLTDLKIMNRDESVRAGSRYLNVPINLTRDLVLPYDANTVTLGFSAFDFLGTGGRTYRCKLEGFDHDWIVLGNRNTVTYTNLDPGEYRFVVSAAARDEDVYAHAATLHLVIRPPYWKTRWAIAAYFVLGLSAFVFIQRYEGQRRRLKQELVIRQLEQEQQSALTAMRNRFFASISHELRTPLTLILGPVEQLLERMTDGEQKDKLSLVRRNASHLLHLINMILDLAKFEARAMKLRLEHTDMAALLRRITAMFQSLVESRELQLVLTADAGEVPHACDRGMIEAAISNLLSNACKYSRPGGRITVALRTMEQTDPLHPGWLCLQVADTGIGIPAAQLSRIFEYYYRVEDARYHHELGTGIGLSLVKEIVELHGGVITVRSEVGQGTEFSIFLPPVSSDPAGQDVPYEGMTATPPVSEEAARTEGLQAPADTLVQAAVNTGRPIVLVIEDNADLRAFIRSILEPDYDVIEAENGRTGLENAISEVPDLVVSDVMMPEMDGYEVTKELKHHELTSHIPVILLTAKASTEARIEGLEHGADDYLAKPFHERELLVRIANLIENRKRLREKWAGANPEQDDHGDPGMTMMDRAFLERLTSIIEENMEDPDFDLQAFIRNAGMSESQVRRKLRALTDQPPSIFIRTLRLKRAASYLLQGDGNVSEIAFRVGFNNLSYFSRSFQELYHVPPSEYRKK